MGREQVTQSQRMRVNSRAQALAHGPPTSLAAGGLGLGATQKVACGSGQVGEVSGRRWS